MRKVAFLVVVLSLTGCQHYYQKGYQEAVSECQGNLELINAAVTTAKVRLDAYKEKCERDRMELENCHDALQDCK